MKREIIASLLLLIALGSIIYGRAQTFHMTDGEALVRAWGCWFTAVWTGIVGAYLWSGKR